MIIPANYYSTSVSEHEEIMQMIEIAENTSTKIEFIANPVLLAKIDLYVQVMLLYRKQKHYINSNSALDQVKTLYFIKKLRLGNFSLEKN
ncbi:MAG: hypothetical protein ACYDAJ_09250 [Nitrosotalea sp.]